jgi:hypothetical protein
VSIGLLTTVFPDERVTAAIEEAGVPEQRNRALPASLMVSFAFTLWLDFGKGYVRVLIGLLTGLRWARDGWDGYTVPTDGAISLACGWLGDTPLKSLFDQTAHPVGTPATERGVLACPTPGRRRRHHVRSAPGRGWPGCVSGVTKRFPPD